MPTYKLTYFNLPGRAATCRMLFKLAGQDFEDNRIDREQWQQLKPGTPMGQLPILEVDGIILCQSNAIARYLARQFGYAGKNDLEQAQVDMIVDSLEDLTSHVKGIMQQEGANKKEAIKNFRQEILNPTLTRLQKILIANGNGEKFIVGDSITWADLAILNRLLFVEQKLEIPDLWNKVPKLKALRERIASEPRIAAWLARRPTASN